MSLRARGMDTFAIVSSQFSRVAFERDERGWLAKKRTIEYRKLVRIPPFPSTTQAAATCAAPASLSCCFLLRLETRRSR